MAYALITGASSGIGREMAALFAADRHDLIITARSQGKHEAHAGTPLWRACGDGCA